MCVGSRTRRTEIFGVKAEGSGCPPLLSHAGVVIFELSGPLHSCLFCTRWYDPEWLGLSTTCLHGFSKTLTLGLEQAGRGSVGPACAGLQDFTEGMDAMQRLWNVVKRVALLSGFQSKYVCVGVSPKKACLCFIWLFFCSSS